MKQILRYSLVALLAMIVGNVMATDITFVPSDFTATDNKDYSLTKDGVTVAVTASTVTADQIRVFKGQTITISSAVGNITKAVFTCTAEGRRHQQDRGADECHDEYRLVAGSAEHAVHRGVCNRAGLFHDSLRYAIPEGDDGEHIHEPAACGCFAGGYSRRSGPAHVG